jgi:hypothetical protein
MPKSTLYNGPELVSIRLLEKQLSFAGHCIRSNQPISELLLWGHTKLVNCKCSKGASNANYSRQLLKAIGRVDRLVTSDEEVRKLHQWEVSGKKRPDRDQKTRPSTVPRNYHFSR